MGRAVSPVTTGSVLNVGERSAETINNVVIEDNEPTGYRNFVKSSVKT